MAAIKAGCAATWRHRQSLTAIICVCVCFVSTYASFGSSAE